MLIASEQLAVLSFLLSLLILLEDALISLVIAHVIFLTITLAFCLPISFDLLTLGVQQLVQHA
jgi:hypothetical protein